ncbi:MAG: metalloregulator ArsR/SmtB family transcription factor [Firmicutes bacterium]|nr:metalloregulator ArsR/SmtB family transcription factor [Bacillota bacterium]MDH7496303.1 metalloregulator ArsR/SmtB family transcription factor [Bacillota bacterium]
MAYGDVMKRRVSIFKALGHETRARIVEILASEGEKCVCDLVERLGFDQSTISKHLSVLKAAGVVGSTKEGLNVRYGLRTPCVYQFMTCIDRMTDDGECVLVCGGTQRGKE